MHPRSYGRLNVSPRMPTIQGAMRRLRDFQAVVLDLGSEARLTCRVVAVQGEDALLQPDLPDAAVLPAGWTPASLSFEGATAPVLLAGQVTAGPLDELVRFAQGDGIRMPQLRASARLDLTLPVTLRPLARTGGRGLAVAAHSVDISAGGVLLGGFTAPPDSTRIQIEFTLPGHGSLSLEGALVRSGVGTSAVRFDEPVPAIGEFVLRCRQEVARLAARRAAETARKLSGAPAAHAA